MEATKYEIMISVEVLDPVAAEQLILEALRAMRGQSDEGAIHKEDGDRVLWSTSKTQVTF